MAFLRCDSYCACLYSLMSYWLWFPLTHLNAAITWTQPPPPYTPSDISNIRTAYQVKLVNGSAVERLSWNYTLTGETLSRITWEKNGVLVGIKRASGSTSIVPKEKGHFNISSTDPATLIIYDLTEDDEALFSCKVETETPNEWTDNIQVTVQVEPKLINTSPSQRVHEGGNVTFFCNATGKPEPNVTWTRLLEDGRDSGVLHTGVEWVRNNINRSAEGTYRCTANNTVGNTVNHTLDLTVYYPPNITEPQEAPIESLVNAIVKIACKATGNPKPNVNWTNLASGEKTGTDGILLFNPITESDDGSVYICTAENGAGPPDSVNISLIVGVSKVTLTIRFPDETFSVAFKDVQNAESKKFIERITSALRSVEMINRTVHWIQVIELRAKTKDVVAEVLLNFSRIVSVQSVISALKAAARNGSLGDLTVDPDSIVQTPEPTTPPPTTTPTESPKLEMWHFIVIGVGALVALILVVIMACWLNKRRNCKKPAIQVHATTDQQPLQELRRSGTEENAYDRVNHGYSESGPTPSSENAQGAASAADVPAYAVVDKSQRKGKKEKQQEIAPDSQNVTYAVVDKSTKKKKKNEKPEDMYGQVDRSKKTKRPKNPGDVLYADLAGFHARGNMPQVAISPELLPPIKMPTAYEKTEYGHITQFLKGDATLPQSVDTSQAAKADQGQSHSPMDSTQAAGGATGANNVPKL